MARTSDETLSTRSGRPFALARYISPSSSSRTGQKSFSKASRLENIAGSPCPEDAVQYSNERLTTRISSVPGDLPAATELEPGHDPRQRECLAFRCRSRIETKQADAAGRAGSVRRHEDRQAETGEMMQRLIDADQRPEPRMLILLRHAVSGSDDPLDAIDGDVNGEVDEGDEPESPRDDQDQRQRYGEVHEAMCEQRHRPAGLLILA